MADMEHILLGVAGSPVFHSRSPLMFRSVFRETGIDGAYIRLAVKNAGETMRMYNELQFNGMNITAPFKESIAPYIDLISDDSLRTGSINTVTSRSGKLSGFNTDHFGVTEPLESRLGNLEGKKCIVIGAGGAGISAAFGLVNKKCNVTILNKFEDKGKYAAEKTGSSFRGLDSLPDEIRDADIIVNTIPYEIGPLDISSIRPGALFFDAGYKKSHYKPLAGKLKFIFIGGEEWLIHQGMHACRHFLGIIPPREVFASPLEKADEKKNIIALTGFMASGKSSVGKALAAKLGWEFADMDTIIEQNTGISINEIFERYGETKFREIESDVLTSFAGKSRIVLSCGGGAVIRERNRNFLADETYPFWLYSSMSVALSRGNDGTRPLIKNMKGLGEIQDLFNKRKHLYASLFGTLVISEGTAEETAELINEEIRLSL